MKKPETWIAEFSVPNFHKNNLADTYNFYVGTIEPFPERKILVRMNEHEARALYESLGKYFHAT